MDKGPQVGRIEVVEENGITDALVYYNPKRIDGKGMVLAKIDYSVDEVSRYSPSILHRTKDRVKAQLEADIGLTLAEEGE